MTVLTCLMLLAVPTNVRGDGSIFFNGGSAATSKLINTGADVLDGSSKVTITAWVKAEGNGEGGFGTVVRLDESGQLVLQHQATADTWAFVAVWSGGVAYWTFQADDSVWNCIQVTYDKTLATNDPNIYVNGALQNEVEGPPPMDTSPTIGMGYCIGNASGGTVAWDGEIAHVQIHNELLTPSELDACRLAPGSVAKNLRLWLPMTNGIDIHDRSGNGFHGTATIFSRGATDRCWSAR
jgi:hypothetical protein